MCLSVCVCVSVFDCLTVGEDCEEGHGASDSRTENSYLPGRGDTMIRKVVHPGRGSAIALRLC